MFAIDTNLLVYAHNEDSEFNEKASVFLEKVLNERDEDGNLNVCIPTQVLTEFVNVITRHNIQSPLSLSEATGVIQDYLDTGVAIIRAYPIWSQYNAFEAADTLLKALETENPI